MLNDVVAQLLIKDDGSFPDGCTYQMRAWSVPPSDDFPEEVKYRFQFMAADGTTLLRYDNAHEDSELGRHHRHGPPWGSDDALSFEGLEAHIRRFKRDMTTVHEQTPRR